MAPDAQAHDLHSLAAKLAALELTEPEQSILHAILQRASASEAHEVGGFVYDERGPRPENPVYEPGPTAESLADAAGVRHVL